MLNNLELIEYDFDKLQRKDLGAILAKVLDKKIRKYDRVVLSWDYCQELNKVIVSTVGKITLLVDLLSDECYILP